jgi:predicted oxidoreductase
VPEPVHQTDVAIVGGGIAGITTALELLEHDHDVLILDRDARERFGGLARWSFGGIFFVDTPQQRFMGIDDSTALALRDWHAFAEFGADDTWPRRWAEQYVHRCTGEVYRWLRDFGLHFVPVVHWVERGLYEPGNSVPRFHMVWGTGKELTTTLIAALRNHRNADRLTCRFRHHVTDLEQSDGRVNGVRGVDERTDTLFRVETEHVVIAAGGICGDVKRLKQHWYPDWGEPPETILNGSHRYADGTLHDEAEAHGAHVTHLDKQWLYAAGVEHPDPDGKPYDALSVVPPKSALWVNHRGERIGPPPLVSGFDTRDLVEQIGRQEKQYSWQVMNWEIATTELAISGSEYNDAMREKKPLSFLWRLLTGADAMVEDLIDHCPDVVAAGTFDGLVREMNRLSDDTVDGDLLRGEIERYDAHIERGASYHNDDQLRRLAHLRQYRGDRTRTCKAQKILDPDATPLIAIREFILSRKSLGGLQTDLDGRVLQPPAPDGSQDPIPGLYAVGEAAGFGGGGIHGLRSLEGTFLGTCILGGRLAGQAIAGGG